MRASLLKLKLLLITVVGICVLFALQSRQRTLSAAAPIHETPHITLDDLEADAVALLNEADGVARVERLVAVPRPQHRIVHIADWHTVPRALYAADLRDISDHPITDAEIDDAHAFSAAVTKVVQASERKLLRWMGRYYGVRSVHLEGVTDRDASAYLTLIQTVGRRGADYLPPDFGAAAQAFLVGDIEEVRAAEDGEAHQRAAEEALGRHLFDGPANTAREGAIVKRLIASGPLAVIVLGGDHDLSEHIRSVPDCEYLRVFVEGYPED